MTVKQFQEVAENIAEYSYYRLGDKIYYTLLPEFENYIITNFIFSSEDNEVSCELTIVET